MKRRWVRYGWIDKKAKRRRFARLYETWRNMRKRCLNPTNPWFYNYGGRGITICDEWTDYAVFREWALENGYRQGLELDRVDSDGMPLDVVRYRYQRLGWSIRRAVTEPVGRQNRN